MDLLPDREHLNNNNIEDEDVPYESCPKLSGAQSHDYNFSDTTEHDLSNWAFNVNMKVMNTGPPGLTSVSDRTREFV